MQEEFLTVAQTGADFTVGAVQRPEIVDESFQDKGSIIGNPFYGLLGGLAVYDRALTAEEIRALAAVKTA